MFEKDYQEAMDNIKFSPDFEARTIEKLERALDYAGTDKARGARRVPRRAIVGAGMGLIAAGLVAAVVLTGPMRWNAPDVTAPVPLSTATPVLKVTLAPIPEVTTAPVPAATIAPIPMELIDVPDVNVVELPLEEAPMPLATSAPAISLASSAEYGEQVFYDVAEVEYEMDDAYLTTGMAPMPDAAAPYLQPQPKDTNEYARIRENGFIDVALEPLSTFGADVDTASYANVRGLLNQGIMPPVDAVRTEEFLNYFSYDYPAPKDGEPFSVTTQIAPCPWNEESQLLLIGLKADDIDASELPPSNLTFLIDVSGSMDEPDKLPLVQRAFQMLIEQLRPEDTVSIVTYAGSDRVVLDGASGRDKAAIATAIDSLFAYGSTDGASGINTAYELAAKHFIEGGNNRVILATDGDLNVGVTSEGALTRLIEQKRESGVFLSVLGVGQGNLKDNKLQALADNGNGNYSYIDSALEARKVLVEEMGANFFTVCKDVKLQVEFNPAKVSKYRLIGYEKRTMAASDFSDDAKDGGEIGAGHTVTALYELVLADGETTGGASLKYQTATLAQSEEYLTVSIRAKQPDGDVSELYEYPVDARHVLNELSDNMRFAAAVAEVCMTLRDSEHKGTSSYADAAALLDSIPDLTQDPYKDEFAYTVRKLAREHGA